MLNFPLLGLWDIDTTVLGVPLLPAALFSLWAFLIVALALYVFIVKFIGLIMKNKKEEAAVPASPTRDQELLGEIRDLLRKSN